MEELLTSKETQELLKQLPELYAQDGKGENATVHIKLHIPNSGYCWYLTEYDPNDNIAFGYTNLNDPQMAELGYISIQELIEVDKYDVVRDLSFKPTTLKEVKKEFF